jgi:DNA-binding FadR family transcriptional regulator
LAKTSGLWRDSRPPLATAGLFSFSETMTPETMTAGTMTAEGLISVQAMTARIACRWITPRQLKAVSDSIDRAARLPSRSQWERKAAAHAEIFGLLGDATGYPALAELAGSAAGWVSDAVLTVGPTADGVIVSSRRRILRCLRTGDADGAGQEMERHLRTLFYMRRLTANQAA